MSGRKKAKLGSATSEICKSYFEKYNHTQSSFKNFLLNKISFLTQVVDLVEIIFFNELSKNSKIIGLDQSKSAIKYIKSLELKNVEVIEKEQ